MLKKSNMETRRSGQKCIKQSIIIPQCGMLLNEENKEEYCQDITEDYDFLRADHYDSIKVHQLVLLESFYHLTLRPRLHGIGRIWDRSEIRPFSPVYTRIRPVIGGLKFVRFRGSRVFTRSKRTNFSPVQIRPCKRGLKADFQSSHEAPRSACI